MESNFYSKLKDVVFEINYTNKKITEEQKKINQNIIELSKIILEIPEEMKNKLRMKIQDDELTVEYGGARNQLLMNYDKK